MYAIVTITNAIHTMSDLTNRTGAISARISAINVETIAAKEKLNPLQTSKLTARLAAAPATLTAATATDLPKLIGGIVGVFTN